MTIYLFFEKRINYVLYMKVPCTTKIAKNNTGLSGKGFPSSLSAKSSILVPFSDASVSGTVESIETVATNHSLSSCGTVLPAPNSIIHALRGKDVSPSRSASGSVSLDESMSTSDSLKSPEFEYIDNEDISEVKSIENNTTNSLYISDLPQIGPFFYKILSLCSLYLSRYRICLSSRYMLFHLICQKRLGIHQEQLVVTRAT